MKRSFKKKHSNSRKKYFGRRFERRGRHARRAATGFDGGPALVEQDGVLYTLGVSSHQLTVNGVEGVYGARENYVRIVRTNPFFVEAVGKTPITFLVENDKATELKAQNLADYKRPAADNNK